MDYSYDSHSYQPSRAKHDSFLQPSSRDVYGYSRNSRSSTRLVVPPGEPISRNKSVNERERRPYHHDSEHRSRSSVRREETYPAFSTRAKWTRRRGSWPPNPSVEDEDEALEKEYPRRRNPKQSDDEVSMPGTVDQNPVLIELENRERRYVILPEDDTKTAKSDAPNNCRRSERPPPLKVDIGEPDLLARRQPSPYAFSKPPQSTTSRSNSDYPSRSNADPFRNESTTTPPTSDDESRQRPRTSRHTNSSSDERQSDDSDLEPAAVTRLRERKSKPRVSFTEPSLSPRTRPEIKRFSSDHTSPTESRPRTSADGPSLLKRVMKQPTSAPSSDDEKPRRKAEKTASSMPRSVPIPVPLPQHIRAESGYGSRPSLQELTEPHGTREARSAYLPPGLPKLTDRTLSGDYYSANGRSSRPSSPSMSNLNARDSAKNAPRSNGYIDTDKDYGSSYERQAPLSARPAPHSRDGSWNGANNVREAVPPPPPVLPYPVDDPIIHMPNHEHYIETPVREDPHSHGRMPDFGTQDYTASPISSPNIGKNGGFPSRPRARSNTTSRRPDFVNGTAASSTGPLPRCPRMELSRKYVDWYTLRGDKSLYICPTCFDGIVRPTPFRLEFVSAPQRPSTVSTRCDFGSAWFRLAWLLTEKRQRKDFDLIYALSAISSIDSACPGSREGGGPWYGLLGADGKFIPGFSICSRDSKFIEACFPSLVGLFHRMPSSSSGRDARMCSMRLPGKHFGDYLNLLEKIDEEARALSLNSSPSLQRLIKFARANVPPAASKKCTRDNLLLDATWHFMPLLPEFTVCEDCFDEVIWPTIKQGSDVAEQFHQVLTPLPAGIRTNGASCQLYSPRMRKVWVRAVNDGEKEGTKLLARKVRERREVGDELREERREISKALERNKRSGGPLAEEYKADCKRRLDDIAREWADWE